MKITAVETIEIAEFPFLFWLRLHTDDGIIGTGETFWAPPPVAAYVHGNAASYLLGSDPRDIELHDRRLGSVYVGARDPARSARQFGDQPGALGHLRAGARRAGLAPPSAAARMTACRSTTPAPATATFARPSGMHSFERTEDWSLKAGDAAEDLTRTLLAWRFNADKPPRACSPEGITG
jgi:hypothetical protein